MGTMIDRLYGALLRLLPREYDGHDREEIWETYQARVARADENGRATTERLRELADLTVTVLRVVWPLPSLDSLRQDVRIGVRSLVRAPLVTALAVGSLALGLGAVTALFSALDVWMIRPLPLPNAERLISVGMANQERGWFFNSFSVRDYADWARETDNVTLGAYARGSYNLNVDDRAERVRSLTVSANLLDVFGVDIVRGRGLTPEDGEPGAPRVAVASHGFWASALGADPGAVGRDVILNGDPFTVIGVIADGQNLPGEPSDLWIPLQMTGEEPRAGHMYWGVGLLHEGTTLADAQRELEQVASAVVAQDPDRTFPNASVRPFRDQIYGDEFQMGGRIIGLSVLFVLLIACANIANVLLARGLTRTHELSVRSALGAGRRRVIQQLLVESLMIAVIGGLLGIGVAQLGLDALLTFALPPDVPGWGEIVINQRMLAISAVLTLASVFVFGLLPAVRASAVDVRAGLTEGARGGGGRGGKLASALVVGEITASLVLLVLSGLMMKASLEARSADLGMELDDRIVFRLDVAAASQETGDELVSFYDRLQERMLAEPGVTGVTNTTGHFLNQWSTVLYSVPGLEAVDERSQLSAEYRRVGYSYRDVLELQMVVGRWFDESQDGPGGPRVAVVTRELASQWWATPADALGQSLSFLRSEDATIVGVVENGSLRGPQRPPPPTIFEPLAQQSARYTFWMLSHTGEAEPIVGRIRAVVRELDPTLAVFDIQTGDEVLDTALQPQNAGLMILGTLGALALGLTLIGVYGVMAHSVGRRMHEMGLRMALGADTRGLVGLVLGGSVKLALIGLGLGVLVSMGAGQGLSFLLAGVSPRDPVVLVSVPVLLMTAIVAATLVPALRAARVDPVRTLRGD